MRISNIEKRVEKTKRWVAEFFVDYPDETLSRELRWASTQNSDFFTENRNLKSHRV